MIIAIPDALITIMAKIPGIKIVVTMQIGLIVNKTTLTDRITTLIQIMELTIHLVLKPCKEMIDLDIIHLDIKPTMLSKFLLKIFIQIIYLFY